MSIRNVFDILETQAKADPVAGISVAKVLADEGFNYYASRLSPGSKITPHYHRAGREVYIILEGRGLFHTWPPGEKTKQSRRVERGAIFDIPPGMIHQLENDSGAPMALIFACEPSHLADDRIPV
jgi:mannose-6-phosphate isomerase-like protein (cupin superfamily)